MALANTKIQPDTDSGASEERFTTDAIYEEYILIDNSNISFY
jgi:hypothetical protein